MGDRKQPSPPPAAATKPAPPPAPPARRSLVPVDGRMKRLKLLLILATMPSEAFGWLVVIIAHPPGRGQVWPDGLGGFRSESQASINAAIAEARTLMESGEVV